MIEREKAVRCSKCGHVETIRYDVASGEFPRPLRCPSGNSCGPKALEEHELPPQNRRYRDIQEIRVQEQVDKLSLGNIPRSITVVLMDDLVDKCKAGDRLTVV
jgi:DNA helicase MCM9